MPLEEELQYCNTKQNQSAERGMKERQDQLKQQSNNNEWKEHGKHKGGGGLSYLVPKGKDDKAPVWSGPDITGDSHDKHGGTNGDQDGKSVREGGGIPRHSLDAELATTSHGDGFMRDARGASYAHRGSFPNARGGMRGS